jgi:glycosyltransferase involved in cell wall biosynthesis
MKKLTRYLVPRLADRFFVVSEYVQGEFMRRGVPRQRLQLLYNPIDTEAFRPDPAARAQLRRQLGLGESEVLLGFLGRIVRSKGVFELAEAAALAMDRMLSLRLLWVGEGGDLPELLRRIPPEHRPRHHFLGWSEAPAAIYPAMDLVVVPSIAPESFGRVSAEAQACGVPVLCSDIGGLRETLQPGLSGTLTAPGDIEALCEQILRLAADAEQRQRMGALGRHFVAGRFSTRQVCEQFARQLRGPGAAATEPRAQDSRAQPA